MESCPEEIYPASILVLKRDNWKGFMDSAIAEHRRADSYAHLQLTTSSSHNANGGSEIEIRATHRLALQLILLSVLVTLGIQQTTALSIDEASFVLNYVQGLTCV